MPVAVAQVVEDAPARRRFAPIPSSALRTMTWAELWTCEEVALATGDVGGLDDVEAEMARRRS